MAAWPRFYIGRNFLNLINVLDETGNRHSAAQAFKALKKIEVINAKTVWNYFIRILSGR